MAIRAIFQGYSFTAKLLITIGVCLVLTTLLSIAGMLLCDVFLGVGQDRFAEVMNDLSDPTGIAVAKLMQVMMSIGFFILPAFLLAFLFEGSPKDYLLLKKTPSIRSFLMVVVLMLAALPIVNAMGEWNSHMQLPEAFSSIEDWMRREEDRLEKLTEAFLVMPGVSDLLINLFVVALLPAVGEELLFRGILQRLFMQWSRNKHVAVWVTAFVFSAIHLQFFGFFPRMLLGALLGYMAVWSGSLWLSVLAHFINNASAVLLSFLFEHEISSLDPDEFGTSGSDLAMIGLTTLFVVLLIRKLVLQLKKESFPSIYSDAV